MWPYEREGSGEKWRNLKTSVGFTCWSGVGEDKNQQVEESEVTGRKKSAA